jgi:tetratricopeptide (TPR) repeat protein
MAEDELEREESRADAGGLNPVAAAMALDGASRAEADAFLARQSALTDAQRDVLRNNEQYEISHLRWRQFGDRMKGVLQAMGMVAGLAAFAALCATVWNAAHADGVVIENFSVPPDLVQKGLSGEVAARQFLDKLNLVLAGTPVSFAAAPLVSGTGTDDIKVEIPETGISLGEAYRFLKNWLGHETRMGGEIFHTADGIALAIRINGVDAEKYIGAETGLDGLLLKAAEHAAAAYKPLSYTGYLTVQTPPRWEQADNMLEEIARDPARAPEFRALALNNLAVDYNRFHHDSAKSLLLYRQLVAQFPSVAVFASNLMNAEFAFGRAERALDQAPLVLRLYQSTPTVAGAAYRTDAVANNRARAGELEAILRGDFGEALRQDAIGVRDASTLNQDGFRRDTGWMLALQHDGAGVRAWASDLPSAPQNVNAPGQGVVNRAVTAVRVAAGLQDWPRVVAAAAEAENAMVRELDQIPDQRPNRERVLRPLAALARAKLGDIAGAERDIAATPGDCYDCVRVRGQIAAAANQGGRADFWFARAVQDAPSVPFAYADWGAALLARGDAAGAIAKFKLSNAKGPHFADALEGWGEALMTQNRSDLAMAKFAEAAKYAPNWGRLHLKWGEALAYAGKKQDAQNQFALTATLDLTAAEKAELARMSHV